MAQTENIIGAETGLKTVMQRVLTVAGREIPVLVYGESGTGKEVIALSIHQRSSRNKGPFKRVNCGAIAPELIDSELFGHEHGAFTGTTSRHKGWFEQSDAGTLLLDEVGELPLSAQVRLLRVLQNGEFTRLGGETTLKVNVRIVAATHRNLPKMIEENLFREDLYYRLAVFPIVIPPLRDRPEDIPALAQYFVSRATIRFGFKPVEPSASDVDQLLRYPWPGNIREFATVIDRAVLLGEGKRLVMDKALGDFSPNYHSLSKVHDQNPNTNPGISEIVPLESMIKNHIEHALLICHGRIDGPFGAARRLKINPNTLRSRMRKLGIDIDRFRSRQEPSALNDRE